MANGASMDLRGGEGATQTGSRLSLLVGRAAKGRGGHAKERSRLLALGLLRSGQGQRGS
jgi:hypothetical protein